MPQRQLETRKTALGTIGSGDVFADLGLPDAETLLLKAKLVAKINRTIEQRGPKSWAYRNKICLPFGMAKPRVTA